MTVGPRGDSGACEAATQTSQRVRDAYPRRYISDDALAEIASWTLVGGLDPMIVPDPAPSCSTVTFCDPLGNVVLWNAISHEMWARPDDGIYGFYMRLVVEIGDAYGVEFGQHPVAS